MREPGTLSGALGLEFGSSSDRVRQFCNQRGLGFVPAPVREPGLAAWHVCAGDIPEHMITGGAIHVRMCLTPDGQREVCQIMGDGTTNFAGLWTILDSNIAQHGEPELLGLPRTDLQSEQAVFGYLMSGKAFGAKWHHYKDAHNDAHVKVELTVDRLRVQKPDRMRVVIIHYEAPRL